MEDGMSYPNTSRIELPILQELSATGGSDDVRFLYDRLASYFPQLESDEIYREDSHNETWRRLVQRAGKELDDKRQINRDKGFWSITQSGIKRVEEEGTSFSFEINQSKQPESLSHSDVQLMLLEIGKILGYYTQAEFDYYDVIWRESEHSPRLSHVFEVHHKGSIDSALAKLKKAYDAQRSKTFLILTTERDMNRALRSTDAAHSGAFKEIHRAVKILSFEQLRLLHRSLTNISDLLSDFLEK